MEIIARVNHSQLPFHVKQAALARRVLFVHGRTGIGKSQILVDTGLEMGIKKENIFDLRVANMDSVELRGFMFPNKETRQTEIYAPSFLPKTEEPSMIIIEEITSVSDPLMQSALYQLTHDYRIGDYIVPQNTIIVATGNMQSDDGVVFQLAAPLQNRMRHVELVSTVDSVVEYAEKQGFHILTQSYLQSIREANGDVHRYSEGRVAFMTSRSLEDMDRFLCNPVNAEIIKASWGVDRPSDCRHVYQNMPFIKFNDITIDDIKTGIHSIIGDTEGETFIHFVEEVMKTLPMFREMFSGKDVSSFKKLLPSDNNQLSFGQYYALSSMIADKFLSDKSLLESANVVNNVVKFIIDNDAAEMLHSEVRGTTVAAINNKSNGLFTPAVFSKADKTLLADFRKYVIGAAGHIKDL